MKKIVIFLISCIIMNIGFLFFLPNQVRLEPKNKVWENRNDNKDFGGVTCMVHHPDSNAVMMIGTKIKGMFISTNFTKRWKNILFEKFERMWINCIAIHPIQRERIIIGTQVGLFISDDFGSTWYERKFGTSVFQVHSISFHPTDEKIVFAGTYEGGIVKSINGGNSWNYLYKGNPNFDMRVTSIQINPKNPQQIFASLYGKGILVSENGGESWSDMSSGIYDQNILSMVMDPLNPSILYAGTLGGIFKTSNSAKNWAACNNGLTAVWKEIYSLVINPMRSDELYAGSSNGYVYYSKDGAKSWEALPQIITSERSEIIWVYALLLDPLHPSMLYAGTNAGVFRFRNSSASMTESLLLEIESPHHNDIVKDTNVVVKGKTSDTEFGIDRVIINQQQALLDKNGHFEHRIPLQFGKNKITITAINNDGFMVSRQMEVFGIVDETEPLICVYYPDTDSIQNVNRHTITISGYVSDPESGIERITINNTNVLHNSKGEFSQTVSLNRGLNTIEITTTNCAGLTSTIIRLVYFEL